MVMRFSGVVPSNVMVPTISQADMPPPVSVGLGAAADDWCVMTATVTSAPGAGAMAAVVKTLRLLGSCPDVSSVCVMRAGGAGLVTVTRAVCAIGTPFALAVTVTVWI